MCHRVQPNAMSKARVTDVNKRVNLCVIMVIILGKVKRRSKMTDKGVLTLRAR